MTHIKNGYFRIEEKRLVAIRHRIAITSPGLTVDALRLLLADIPGYATLVELPSHGPDHTIIDFIETCAK